MLDFVFTFHAKLWLYPTSAAPWYFITLPADEAAAIHVLMQGKKRGFGSVRVKANIGQSHWKTSVFPDKKSNSYLLPVKAAVRKAESIDVDDVVKVVLEVEAAV